jgi:cytochrome c-type biogenesis protein CcmH/NrfG
MINQAEMSYDTNEQVLKELRRLRRGCEITYVILFLILAGVGFAIYAGAKAKAQREKRTESWGTVRAAMDRFDYDKAYEIAQRIVAKYPSNYFGHTYLGSISIATGHFQNAERHYGRAYELLPSEENEKILQAVRKRLGRTATQTQTAASTNPR